MPPARRHMICAKDARRRSATLIATRAAPRDAATLDYASLLATLPLR